MGAGSSGRSYATREPATGVATQPEGSAVPAVLVQPRSPSGEGSRRPVPRHVACVMDGNGRWAQQRSLPRTSGHRAAEATVIDVIEAARSAGVEWLSLYAFSTENWRRPGEEIDFLMRLVRRVVRKHALLLHARGIRCRLLGAEDPRIPAPLAQDFADLMTLTEGNRGMTLTVAFDHGGRQDIVAAARSLIRAGVPADAVDQARFAAHLPVPDTPDVDLVIRTSGEQRISNFMLWQVAYAEWIFPPVLWPDFRAPHLLECLHEYRRRDRRFGGVAPQANGGPQR
ncbi:polyprenyl diphosphate synthase [Streptomyces sp. NPDC048438]|uniref:polyprenyl diphosphate synthase n=1 Tax=Streptomyces sp. NPDC048438 TaxID=3365551 RepID=UPI00371794E0